MKRFLTKTLVRLLRIAVLFLLVASVLLWFRQDSMIYFPRKYPARLRSVITPELVEINSTTSQGRQKAFCLPPRTGPPLKIWAMFAGNGSLALDWLDFVQTHRDPGAAYLFVDYPGYGFCEGRPSPATILESTEAAWRNTAALLKLTDQEASERLGVVGHSIGCAAALQFAARHPVRQVILLAPFTSMRDMAQRVVGWPLCLLSRHRFDNRERLAELAGRSPRPEVIIFHGTDDVLIPVSMSRELRDLFPAMVQLREIPDSNHELIVPESYEEMAKRMRQ